MRRLFRFATLVGISMSSIVVFSQNTNSGDIRGTVTDSGGAVVPGVTVTIQDVDKNVNRTYVTDGAGLYDTGSIVPDHYIIHFTKDGFDTYTRGPITVGVNEVTVNGELKVGSTVEQVVVNADLPLLETETGTQSTTLASETMAQLPQIGSSWTNFVILSPGTSGSPQTNSGGLNPGYTASANGNLPYANVLADGASTTLPMSQNSSVAILDTVSEVKISDSAFSAQYGTGGVIYNQITKGGTNQFHGEGYEYFQNNALNAAPYSFGAKAQVPVLHYNEYGGNVGGPILKNRMFFFFDFDKTINNGGASNGFVTVPNAAMLAGDFTGMSTIYDPTTQTVDSSGVVHRQSFASEYGNGNKIPTSMIDSVAKAIEAYYPAPNVPGTIVDGIPTNNFFYNVPSPNPYQKYFGRLDYDVTSHHRLMISETEIDNPSVTYNQGICPINCQSGDNSSDNAQISDVWVVRPNTINEARIGFTDGMSFYSPFTLNQGFPAKLGWKFSKADVFPALNISGEYGLQPSSNSIYKEAVFDPSDVVTMIQGRHALHFGGEFLIERADSTAWGNINGGTMQFSGAYTASSQGTGNTTGLGYADFLLGQASGWYAGVTPEYGARLKTPQAFVQDDFKVRPNLTVNLGIRWQGVTGWSEVKGNARTFDPEVFNPASASLGAMWYGISKAHGRSTLQAPIYNTFLPRLGFSYLLHSDTTIRGGFGLYAYTWSIDTYGGGIGQAFASNGGIGDSTNGVSPVVILDSDGNTNYQGSGGSSVNAAYLNSPTNASAYNGQSVGYNQYHTPVAKIYQWNLDLQHELSANLMVDLAYVGSHGVNLVFPVDINQVPESALGPNDASGSTNARPYTQYQSIQGSTNNAISNYNALQTSLQKRLSSGLQFNFNYTWSHFLDEQDSSGWGGYSGGQPYQNAYVPSENYGPSNYDIRNMFKGSAVYTLPFGKGKQFLNNSTVLDEVIGGWTASGTLMLQGGNPFTVVMANNNSYSQAGSQYPNVMGNPHLASRSNQEWFNVAAYVAPSPGTFGDSSRNSLYGPGLTAVNLSLGKDFPMWEKVFLQFHADVYNPLNHPSFGQPDSQIGPGHNAQITSVTVGGRQIQLVGRLRF